MIKLIQRKRFNGDFSFYIRLVIEQAQVDYSNALIYSYRFQASCLWSYLFPVSWLAYLRWRQLLRYEKVLTINVEIANIGVGKACI